MLDVKWKCLNKSFYQFIVDYKKYIKFFNSSFIFKCLVNRIFLGNQNKIKAFLYL